jgi:hypothetical protein
MLKAWDAISMFVFALCAYPFIKLFESFEEPYIFIVVGLIVAQICVKLTRLIPFKHTLFYRPDKAKNCSIFNCGGACNGKVGMPSGHVLKAAYVVTSLVLIDKSIKPHKVAIGFIIIALIAMSRVRKQCHNVPQVIIGGIFGTCFGIITN